MRPAVTRLLVVASVLVVTNQQACAQASGLCLEGPGAAFQDPRVVQVIHAHCIPAGLVPPLACQ